MNIRPIHTDEDYRKALAEIHELSESKPGTEEFDRLDIWATLVEAYETSTCPIEPPDPISAIEFAAERLGLSIVDLAAYIGGRERGEEILHRRRKLTLPMIHRLSRALDIPVSVLAQNYTIQRRPRSRKSTRPLAVA